MSESFEEQVNSVASAMTQAEDGNWVIPEDLEVTPEVKFAANLEKRRRDTQAAYGKTNQRLKALEVENAELAKGWESDVSLALTEEQEAELNELKHSDPDAWRVRLNEVEAENKSKFEETKTNIVNKAKTESELERRTRVMAEFSEANPDLVINDQVINDDVPPKYTRQLSAGEITFDEFLETVKTYLTKGRVLEGGEGAPKSPDLSKSGGSSKPTEQAVNASISESYKNETY
jgi:hypothetical protein